MLGNGNTTLKPPQLFSQATKHVINAIEAYAVNAIQFRAVHIVPN